MLTGMTQHIATARSQADLLAMLPQLTGFPLEHSVLFVAFRGNRSHGAFRIDIPPRSATTRAVHALTGLAARFPADVEFVVVIYDQRRRPVPTFVQAIRSALDAAGFGIRDLLWQSDREWGCYFDDCVNVIEAGVAPLPMGLSNAVSSQVDPDSHYEVSAASVRAALQSAAHPVANRLLVRAVEAAVSPEASAQQLMLVGAALQCSAFRDLVLLQWAFGEDCGTQCARELRLHTPVEERLWLDAFTGQRESGPSFQRIALALTACVRMRALGIDELMAPLWTIEGWLSWAVGESSRAGMCFAHALEADPAYELAILLDAMTAAGTVPEWAYSALAG